MLNLCLYLPADDVDRPADADGCDSRDLDRHQDPSCRHQGQQSGDQACGEREQGGKVGGRSSSVMSGWAARRSCKWREGGVAGRGLRTVESR